MASLPVELRRIIYAECVKIRAFGLLYVNKKFHNEFQPFLNEEFILRFHIDPSSSTEVTITDPDNSPWGRRSVLDAASPHPDYSILDAMPIDRFKGIHIVIDPPSTDDPGQVVRGWLQSNALVTALLPRIANAYNPTTEKEILIPDTRLSARLPPVAIQVREGKTHKWHTEGSWNKTLPNFTVRELMRTTVLEDERPFSDLKIILTPLVRLRNADAIELELPSAAPMDSYFQDFQDSLIMVATRKKLFGLELNEALEHNDGDTQAFEDALYVWLDFLLDDMRGPSAAELRRDRFKFWCSQYERQIGRRVHGLFRQESLLGGANWFLEEGLYSLITRSFHDRFMSAREHVLAAYRDYLRRHGHSVYLPNEKKDEFWVLQERVERLGLGSKLGNDETFWEVCYPSGIQPMSENDNWENTQHIDIRYRLEPPEWESENTASQKFPPDVAGCKHCDQDKSKIEILGEIYEEERDYLFNFSLRPRPLVLEPINPPSPAISTARTTPDEISLLPAQR